jgi:hypothetical protein
MPIYFRSQLSRISNLPPFLCIVFSAILSRSIDRTDQQEHPSTALLKLLLLSLNSSALLCLPNLVEIVLITCLINCNKQLVDGFKLYDISINHLETNIVN